MKYVLKSTLVMLVIALLSCNFHTKKPTNDSAIKSGLKQDYISSKSRLVREEKGIDANVVFPNFVVKLHDFCADSVDAVNKLAFVRDSSKASVDIEKNKSWTLTAKTDTVYLQCFVTGYYGIIELIPKEKTDNFEISYASNVLFTEVKEKQWKVMSDYRPLADSLNYFFKTPQSVYNNSNINEVKEKLKLKDTLTTYKASDGKTYAIKVVSYKGRAAKIEAEAYVYLKIERFNNNKLMEAKFLKIELINSEDAD